MRLIFDFDIFQQKIVIVFYKAKILWRLCTIKKVLLMDKKSLEFSKCAILQQKLF